METRHAKSPQVDLPEYTPVSRLKKHMRGKPIMKQEPEDAKYGNYRQGRLDDFSQPLKIRGGERRHISGFDGLRRRAQVLHLAA
jgi:hypothetical protein